jgi:acyl-CoA synthetase (AMP-forming)/AMP-acid ligase II
MTIAGGIRASAARGHDRIALRLGARTRSYGELIDRIDRVANATLADPALPPHPRAAIIAANSMEYIEIVCGVPEAGVPVATINAKLSPTEMAAACDDAQTHLLFVDVPTAAALRGHPLATATRIIELGPDYESWLRTGAATPRAPAVPVQEWDTWTIPYTSGTTGKPKGVMLPHRARIMVHLLSHIAFGCFGPYDRFLTLSPMNHGAGLGFPIACLLGGGSIEIMDSYQPALLLDRLTHGGITGVFLVPTHFHGLFDLDPALLAAYRTGTLKTIIANAAPLSHGMKQRIIPLFGDAVLHEIYGATESGLVTSLPPQCQLSHIACVGLPFAHTELRVLSAEGHECAPGEIGEVFSRSPASFSGYWNRPAETAAAFRHGWLSVGDMGRRDADGFLYLVDRKHDLIITGGINVYPREIEDVLLGHPAISEAAVIGVPDDKWGERLKAFLVLHPGHTLSQHDLEQFCATRLARFKVPRETATVAALPRNANGKILKRELRDQPG